MKLFLVANLIFLIISIAVWFYYHRSCSEGMKKIWAGIVVAASVSYIFSHSDFTFLPVGLVKIVAWFGNSWLIFVFYSFLVMLVHLGIMLLGKILKRRFVYSAKLKIIGVLCVVVIIAFGALKAFEPIVREETVISNKQLDKDYRIVLVTDLHLGRILEREFAESVVKMINDQAPDIVLIAGDIVDERLSFVKQNKSMEPLANLNPAIGTFACMGNHDYLDRQPEVVKQMLSDVGVNVLENEKLVLNEHKLKLVGLKDYSRDKTCNALRELAKVNEEFSIVIDHQPRRIRQAAELKYDLYVSGHTHTGQVWPLKMITERMYLLDYGKKQFDDMVAIVSNGIGFWGPPIRVGLSPEIVVINIKRSEL